MSGFNEIIEKEYADSRVLVTGSSGFVAPYLMSKLLQVGATVYGIDRRKSRSVDTLKRIKNPEDKELYLISADLNDISSIANSLDASEPDHIFHLGAQSYVPESFINPVSTLQVNTLGTANLLEAVRLKNIDTSVVLAGSSEEYGLVVYSEKQWNDVLAKYGSIFPTPTSIPEVPIRETNPLRPMSPYAVSKVAADHLMRNFHHTYGIRTIVSRAFNHEGAGRGDQFVTSVITRQIIQLKYKEKETIDIGDVTAFRDWSHVDDIIDGYLLLSAKGESGEVYNQGSQRTNSVLSFILLSLQVANYDPLSLKTIEGSVSVDDPCRLENATRFGLEMPLTKIDQLLLDDKLSFDINQKGILVETKNGTVKINFNPERFRPSDVPILLSETSKIRSLGFMPNFQLKDIITDQLNYYMNPQRRSIEE